MTAAAALDAGPVGPAVRAGWHRADLEGLRGLAVLSVFAVHAIPDSLAGGFVGVDVFFVLSGYLIASISLGQIDAGRFSALAFYGRRLRRLIPALLVVLSSCLAFAALLALPQDVRGLGRQLVAGATFTANLLFWREAGYFDPSSEYKPLLHLWSLGIEAQFYALWPLLALGLERLRSPSRRLVLVSAVLLASFGLNVAGIDIKPKAVFFLPVTRIWELLMGVLLAIALTHPSAARRIAGLPNALAVIGALLIVLSLLLVDKTASFPGWWALLPTLGTVAIIAGGGRGWFAERVLAQPLLTFYGRISYPLYLWHFPLLVIPRLLGMELDAMEVATLLVLAVGAATATERWAEPALRSGPIRGWRAACLWGGLPAVALAGLWLTRSDGWPERYPAALQDVAHLHQRFEAQGYRGGLCFLNRPEMRAEAFSRVCDPTGDARFPSTLLWGDSHGAALYPGLADALRSRTEADHPQVFLGQYTAAACPPLPVSSTHLPDRCKGITAGVLRRVAALQPHRVVLVGSWTSYDPASQVESLVQELVLTVRELGRLGVKDIVVVGPLPVWRVEPPRRALGSWAMGAELDLRPRDGITPRALQFDQALATAMQGIGARYWSPLKTACDTSGCVAGEIDAQGRVRANAFDISHLTATGSAAMARDLLPFILAQGPAR